MTIFRYGQRDASSTVDASLCHVPDATANGGWHKRASGMPVLPSQLLMLLLPEASLPRQARAIGHALRVRVLQPQVPHKELTDDAQKPPASRLERQDQEAAQDLGDQERPKHYAPGPNAAAAAMKTSVRSELTRPGPAVSSSSPSRASPPASSSSSSQPPPPPSMPPPGPVRRIDASSSPCRYLALERPGRSSSLLRSGSTGIGARDSVSSFVSRREFLARPRADLWSHPLLETCALTHRSPRA
ncbi:hypothetical protein KM043_008268 [Ampulex compressa]|nr:hypothetical protein KM043_008268 [Ampulex compressa]